MNIMEIAEDLVTKIELYKKNYKGLLVLDLITFSAIVVSCLYTHSLTPFLIYSLLLLVMVVIYFIGILISGKHIK